MKKSSYSEQANENDNSDAGKESTDESASYIKAGITNDIEKVATHTGQLLIDLTTSSLSITYRKDVKLLKARRERSQAFIDKL